MRTSALIAWISIASVLASAAQTRQAVDPGWTSEFKVDASDWTNTGRNPYFVLEPGYTLTLEHGDERLVVTVLADAKIVDGVTTRVVEERETNGADLVEVSRNYFAMSVRTNAVFYFGEDVDMYKGGKVVSHEGSWLAGVDGAKFGLMMPGLPLVKARYYQEIAPKVAMDRAEIVSVSERLQVPAGAFTNVVKTIETSQLEAGPGEAKYYAEGVGLLQDGSFKLVKYGKDKGFPGVPSGSLGFLRVQVHAPQSR
ncbi:MAG TPA: hypothetical protein VJN96_17665 [Vicinamibacterales bacterium]|nr:hypothetical protein [Vicinamibacterales bacterium]